MSSQRQFRAIKGTRDILPPDSALWNWFDSKARETFEAYGFRDIRTPVFEETDLFARSIGADTDIVGKEMFTFEDHELPGFELDRAALLAGDVGDVDFSDNLSLAIGRLERARANGELNEASASCLDQLTKLESDVDFDALLRGLPDTHDDLYNAVREAQRLIRSIDLGRVVTLRPECTAGVCRAYVEHGMHTLPGNVKLYYSGPMFRRERPQKGRYRQFYQMGAEVLGQSDAPGLDAEVLEMLMVFFRRVGLDQITLYVNSIGHNAENCRLRYIAKLREALQQVKDKLGPDSQRRIDTNPLRVLDSKLPEEQPIIETLPRITDFICDACREHFTKLKEELALRRVAFVENWRLVRGLDYYTRTTFEVTAAGLGSQNAVCGGGRYDGLVELLGGQPTKGIGFAIGTDRAILSIQESGKLPHLPGLSVYIAWMSPKCYPTAVALARKLRDAGVSVELPTEEMKFKKSLGLADKLGAKYALIIGEDEVASGTYSLKRLADAHQQKLSEPDLLEYLESERRMS